jgi:hypothetical protein
MEQHVKIISVLYILFGILGLVAAIAILLFGAGAVAAMFSADTTDEGRAVIGVIGGCVTFIGVLFGLMAIPSIIAGWGLSQRKSWARILTIILGIFALPNMPIGTALGIYSIVIMFNDETKRLLTQ